MPWNASIEDAADLEYVYVPLTRNELVMLIELWESSDTRYTHDVSVQLKARGAIGQLDDLAARKRRQRKKPAA